MAVGFPLFDYDSGMLVLLGLAAVMAPVSGMAKYRTKQLRRILGIRDEWLNAAEIYNRINIDVKGGHDNLLKSYWFWQMFGAVLEGAVFFFVLRFFIIIFSGER